MYVEDLDLRPADEHARPPPAEAPDQPCTVPAYDAGSASGRMLVLDLGPATREALQNMQVEAPPPAPHACLQ